MTHMFQTFAQRAAELEQKDPHKMRLQNCPCGSGLERYAEKDARGIFLCYVCDICRYEKLKQYRPDVLTDPNYWTEEPIDSED
jgi:hypothetical protein